MPIGFALCHGWALDRQSLFPLQSMLSQHFPSSEIAAFDLGFTGCPHQPALSPERRWIAVGHSYGFCYLMQQSVRWEAAVAINGFLRFCRRPGKPAGISARVIDSMLSALSTDPDTVVRSFYEQCGVKGAAPDTLDTPMLRAHLARLRDVDLAPPACKTLAVYTEEDGVVPPQLSEACFPAPAFMTQCFPGNHMSLMVDPAPVLPRITQLVEDLHD